MSNDFVAQDEIKAILKSAVAPPLKQHGYHRTGNTWRKDDAGMVKVLNVQLSRWNAVHEAQFTINLGIFHPEFHSLRGMVPPGKDIKEHDCDVRIRIGQLMGRDDYWWNVASHTDTAQISHDVEGKVERVALPWLDAFGGLADFLPFFRQHSMHFDAAIASHLLGKPETKQLLAAAAASANPLFRQTLNAWAIARGYSLPTL